MHPCASSSLFDTRLFLGVPLSEVQQQEMDLLSPLEKQLFIQDDEESPYLRQITHNNIVYLGKYLGASFPLKDLSAMEEHIHSLLRRLNPLFSKHALSLALFPVLLE